MKLMAARPEWKIAALVLLVGLGFAAFTRHAWEDYWITFRISRNLATGHGLVYTSGERLHSFTSPLGVLLPAMFSWLTGNQSDLLVLWLFRVVSLMALAGGMVLIFKTLQALPLQRFSCWLTVALIGLDAKTVDFSINGMETGLLIFFLALSIHGLMVAGPRQVWRIGAGWAGLMWSRPDSFVYIAILGLGTLLFLAGGSGGKSRVAWGKTLLAAGLICAALYIGWFLWAWWYYGSPVPHTIVAKSTNQPPILFDGLVTDLSLFPWQLLTPFATSLPFTLLPGYFTKHGGWPEVLVIADCALGYLAIFAWVLPRVRPQVRFCSLAYFLGNFYLSDVLHDHHPWYLPTVTAFGYLTIGLLFDQAFCLATNHLPSGEARRWSYQVSNALRLFGVGLLLGQVAVTVCVARQLQLQQQLIENGLRRPIGLWLREHAQTPHDTVMLEPLGYIGYYSGLKMLDWPGLASREMVETRIRLGPWSEHEVGLELLPDWLIQRPTEARAGVFIDPVNLQKFYAQVKVFDASDKINAIRWLPGRAYLQYDQTFLVYHRKPEAPVNSPASGSRE
jgi:hypothetical protein